MHQARGLCKFWSHSVICARARYCPPYQELFRLLTIIPMSLLLIWRVRAHIKATYVNKLDSSTLMWFRIGQWFEICTVIWSRLASITQQKLYLHFIGSMGATNLGKGCQGHWRCSRRTCRLLESILVGQFRLSWTFLRLPWAQPQWRWPRRGAEGCRWRPMGLQSSSKCLHQAWELRSQTRFLPWCLRR